MRGFLSFARDWAFLSYPSFTKINGLQYKNSKNSFINIMLDGEDRDPEGDTDYYFSARCTYSVTFYLFLLKYVKIK